MISSDIVIKFLDFLSIDQKWKQIFSQANGFSSVKRF